MLVLSALTFILMEHVMSVNGNSTLMPYESLVAENFALNSTSFSPTFVKESVTESSNFVQNLLESVNDWNRDGNDNSSTYYAHVPSMFSYGTYCTRWRPTNHIFFQLANMCLFLSHLAPIGLYGLVFLRLMLMAASAFLCAWSFGVICMYDSFVWNTMFVVINAAHMCVLLYYIRPIRFSSEVEEVYEALFRPLKVSRAKFQKVLGCMKMIRTLKYQEVYAQEKATKVDSLSLVLSGKLVVSQGGRALHIVFPHQFLDSPEWFGVSTDEYFQVSITAMEWSRVLIWHRDKLRLSIITDQFLQAVFDHILGRDVVKKLMQVSETMAASNNGHVPNMEDIDDKPILIVKKQGDGPGITALINRQLQEEHAPLLAASSALYSRCVSSTRPGIGIIYTTDSSASATDPAVSI